MGSPYEDGRILPLDRQAVQKGHPVNGGTVLRTMPRRLLVPLVLLMLVAAPAAEAKSQRLTVMTRNIYLGGNIALPIGTQSRQQFEQKATQLWQEVQTTNFPARAKLLAREVRQTKPDLIGLQEVARWRQDGTTVYDFLALLRKQLKRAGQRYRVGRVQVEADIEAPISSSSTVRLTMRDVVLVRKRKGLRVRRALGANYAADFRVDTPVGTKISRRGWAAVDATLKGKRFRFVDTHLESFDPGTRLTQARALVAGPVRKHGTVIVVGDLNSDPTGATGATPDAYRAFIDAGLRDTWLLHNPSDPGYECCLKQETIMDPPPGPFDHRIDHILAKGRFGVVRTRIVGTNPANRTASGLWPSDHGGVATTLSLR
jgi:endonuclease/exonuclease/phosphatase family metal-dependent hydrolase